LILSKTEIDLLPTTSAAKKHSRPSATAAATTKEADRALQQLRATSEDHNVHSVEKSPRQLQCSKAPKKTPEEPKTSPQAGRQLLTLKNSLTVIPLKPLYQRDGPSQGET